MTNASGASVADRYADLDAELESTRRMLERFPDGQDEWKPHDKSRPLGALAAHLAQIPNRGVTILTTDSFTPNIGAGPSGPVTAASLVAELDAASARLHDAMAAADLASLDRVWKIELGGRTLLALPKAAALRTVVISHMIHHRAQLGVYYRLLGVPVPGVYGPSADE